MSRRAGLAFPVPVQTVLRGLLMVLAATCAPLRAEEVALFAFTGMEGHVATRYLDDRSTTTQGSGATRSQSAQAESGWRNELFVMTNSYIYHPNFLTLDIGGGPILQFGELDVDNNATRSRGVLYNLVGRATFLRGKPVNGALFYEHLNPTQSLAPGEVLQQETSRYGAELVTTPAAGAWPARLEFTRSEAHGRSGERLMNDRQDVLNLRMSRDFGNRGSTQLQYQGSRQESVSGSTALPIQAAASTGHSLNVDTRLHYGADGRHELIQLLSMNRRRYVIDGHAEPEQADATALLDLRLKHSPDLASTASWHYSFNDNGDRAAITHAFASALDWSPDKDLELSVDARAENHRAESFSMSDRGVGASIGHVQPLPVGSLRTSYRARHDRRSQRAQAREALVIGERVGLAGSTATTLTLPHVVAGSVVVSNATRSQVYLENIDFELTTVGRNTRLRRLVGGAILDGEEVLVDYEYDLGGTFAHARTDQTFDANWVLTPQISLYLREHRSAAEVLTGTPTFPLDDSRSRLFGARADFPLHAGVPLTAGGSVEREKVEDRLSPLTRASAELYVQTEEPPFDIGNFGVSLRRMTMDYANSPQGMDLAGYGLRFTTRRFGAELSAVRNFECDRGGPVVRCRANDAVNVQWRERRLTMTARLARGRETQGDFERAQTLVQFTLRRDL